MKNTARKITALIMVFVFILSFSACKNKVNSDASTTAEATGINDATAANGTVPATSANDSSSVETTGTTLSEGTTAVHSGSTTPAAAIKAPVGGSTAQIVAFYNQYANATKEYKGKINVQRNMGTVTKITKFGNGLLEKILQGVLDKKLKDKYENKTFVNGKNPTNSNDTLEKFLPRGSNEKMSVLEAAGVKRASCMKSGTGWKVEIVLNKEVSTIDKAPKYHSSVMDPLEIDSNSLDPFTLGDGKVIYGQINAPYDGATIVAIVNSKGYLDHLRMDAPLQISGKLGYKKMGNIETVIDGKFWGDMTFKY